MLVEEEVLDSMRTILLMLGRGGISNLSILPLFFFFLGWVTTAQPDVFTYDAKLLPKPILGNSLATSTSSMDVMSQ